MSAAAIRTGADRTLGLLSRQVGRSLSEVETPVWQARKHKGARVVNEPGSLNFNVLSTRDPAAAKRFYGAVFGWTTLDLGAGEFWALSGYGDYLETLTPGVRQRTAELGAAGFEDVVAAIAPIAGDDPDSSADWGVTFSTADADATAAKAAELGGTVVAPPIDAPYSRMNSARRPAGSDVLRDGLRAREQRRWPQSHLNGPPRLPNAYHLLSRARTHARARTRSRVLPPPSMR